mmetsp:Transcript_93560/g.180383  ORF Transcript_93560/g.180383 Transcript_93560/m.180383 type:complete len:382 (-) Transcript_93560:120-1265(-)|eukprot:CAMPEP_0172710454 /NCGR_PEP_ID=MMETSP1074-20121228/55668_1 /TAXON_ID=2916 /ORGANISM="Ceratium fusus, Strain PA161109" /LENGTH=381 /DNA_ID=CAMNT_0013533859 /DNA_START=42 /DNA_END=1187 /DNA_ORIENTATION=+
MPFSSGHAIGAPGVVLAGEVAGELYGVVKSWNGSKGFGFIISDAIHGDIFFSRNELPEEAREVRGTFLEGRRVSFVAQQGNDGRVKASSVAITAAAGQPVAGIIKSYSEQNRYGFVTSSSLSEDARFQSSDLPQVLPGINLKGKLVIFETQQLQDGKLRVTKMQFQTSKIAAEVAPNVGGFTPFGAPAANVINPAMTGFISGIVKSFSEKHGYGFVNIPGQPIDIKFGRVDVMGSNNVDAGEAVKFVPTVGPDGRLQAKNVQPDASRGGIKRTGVPTSMLGVSGGDRPGKQQRYGGADLGSPEQLADPGVVGQYLTGAVKSYIPSTGFGFISCPDVSGDIYFSKHMIPPELQNIELKGQGVNFELSCAPDGKLRATNVTAA